MKTSLLLGIVLFTISFTTFSQADLCANATLPANTLPVNAACVNTAYTVPSTFADNFVSEPSCGTNFVDGFFSFVATSTSTVVTITDATIAGANPGLMVLSGACGGPLTELACSETGNGNNETVTVPTTIGQTYLIVIFSINNAGTGAPAGNTTGNICVYNAPVGSTCGSAQNLPLNTSLCNTNSYAGSFPDGGTAPGNPCNVSYNDGEYWYSVVGTGQALNIALSGLTATYSGIFVLDACPGTANCIANAVAGGSTANYSVNTPVLTNGVTYYIVVANWSAPYSTNFCIQATVTTPPIVAPDCSSYVNVCSNLGFQIDPNGFGLVNEIPASGSFGNPLYDGFFGPFNPWGSLNDGCLQIGESNSTWMVINVSGSGNLEFSFGAGGAQAGFYDWIMYPYTGPATCAAISGNTLAPVRCNWNAASTGGTGLASVIPAGGNAGNYEPPLAVTAGQQYIICFSNYSSSSTNVPLQFGGTATVSCTPLGLSLYDMEYEENCEEGYIDLHWKAPKATNETLHFTIQVSEDTKEWTNITSLNAPSSETESTNYYSNRVPLFAGKTTYCRVIETNDQGVHSSSILSIFCKESIKLFSLVPNPSSEFTSLIYMSKSSGTMTILDGSGRVIKVIDLPDTEGKIIALPLDISQFDKGSYIFQVNTQEKHVAIKFVKQ